MKIAIGSDHAGFKYKQALIDFLKEKGHQVQDFGTDSDQSCDYPDFIIPVAKAVAAGEFEKGIVLGGSGNGEAMAANRIKSARCALCWNADTAQWASSHNHANMLSIGQRTIPLDLAKEIVDIWLNTPFEGGRHQARIDKIDSLS